MRNDKKRTIGVVLGLTTAVLCTSAGAAVISVPQSALAASTDYYSDTIGGGIGNPLTMTGGGNGANVGGMRNDDGYSGPIPLGFTLNFFGNSYNQFWANNNGNVSFQSGISDFTPDGPQGAAAPIISPFFADVDTRDDNSGLMYLRTDIANEIIVTWDHVGYFDSNGDLLNSFQLVLRGPDYNIPSGEGAIGFFYKDMAWESGEASGGSNGFGGTPAAVGFGNGGGNGEILAGSTEDGISSVVDNHHIWFDANLAPVEPGGNGNSATVPEPAPITLLAFGLALIGFTAWRRKRC